MIVYAHGITRYPTALWFTLKSCKDLSEPLFGSSCEFWHYITTVGNVPLCLRPFDGGFNYVLISPLVTTAILQCCFLSNVFRAGREERLHLLFLILNQKLSWDIGGPAEEIKMSVTSPFFLRKRFGNLDRKWRLSLKPNVSSGTCTILTLFINFIPSTFAQFSTLENPFSWDRCVLNHRFFWQWISGGLLIINPPNHYQSPVCFPTSNYSYWRKGSGITSSWTVQGCIMYDEAHEVVHLQTSP